MTLERAGSVAGRSPSRPPLGLVSEVPEARERTDDRHEPRRYLDPIFGRRVHARPPYAVPAASANLRRIPEATCALMKSSLRGGGPILNMCGLRGGVLARLSNYISSREVARDAPYRYVHALFHPRLDVRRASLDGELPIRLAELAIYVFLDELNRCQESARNALMPALDATRRVYHPIENTFIPIPDNVQFIAAVNRGREFTGTFGIDAAQLDRFAPLQMDYPPPKAEIEILAKRHPAISAANLEIIVGVADAIRSAADLPGSLSVRATDEACVYLAHPLFADDGKRALPEIMKTSFCGRFPGRWDDVTTDAGAVWSIVRKTLASLKVPLPDEAGAKE